MQWGVHYYRSLILLRVNKRWRSGLIPCQGSFSLQVPAIFPVPFALPFLLHMENLYQDGCHGNEKICMCLIYLFKYLLMVYNCYNISLQLCSLLIESWPGGLRSLIPSDACFLDNSEATDHRGYCFMEIKKKGIVVTCAMASLRIWLNRHDLVRSEGICFRIGTIQKNGSFFLMLTPFFFVSLTQLYSFQKLNHHVKGFQIRTLNIKFCRYQLLVSK